MTNPSVLLELAGRVEALTGRDREVDFQIADAVLGEIKAPFIRGRCEKYTASIEAAMTLVPAECYSISLQHFMLDVSEGDDPPLMKRKWSATVTGASIPFFKAFGCNEASALTAACLRALAAREG